MTESARCPNPVANFWEWYQRRQKRGRGPMARYSLDKCEESYRRSDWESFGYWFEIYLREQLSIDLEADERLARVTGRAGAS